MPTLDFKGRQYIYAHHLTVPLEPDDDRSINSTGVDNNSIIHGDRLQALMAFQPRYTSGAPVHKLYVAYTNG